MFRPLTITAVLNGWIVTCGCQTVVYQDHTQLVADLHAYLTDPDATEQRFLTTGVNRQHTGGPATAPTPPDPRSYGASPVNTDCGSLTFGNAATRSYEAYNDARISR